MHAKIVRSNNLAEGFKCATAKEETRCEMEGGKRIKAAREKRMGEMEKKKGGRDKAGKIMGQERAGGRPYTKPTMKYSIFNQTPSIPVTSREKDELVLVVQGAKLLAFISCIHQQRRKYKHIPISNLLIL